MMFFKRHKKVHITLMTALAVILLFHLTKGNRGWMNFLAQKVTGPVKDAISQVSYAVSFSMMELVIAIVVVAVAAAFIRFVAAMRKEGKGRAAYGFFMGLVSFGLSVYALFCLFWGVNYYTDSFQDRSGLTARMVTVEELQTLGTIFAQGLSETADLVARDENGLFAEDQNEIFQKSVSVYDNISQEFPCLAYEDRVPKAMAFGRIMSRMGFTGVYFAFLGESNLNVDAPAAFLPVTIAHELGHQRSIASEQECNFTGIMAAIKSDNAAYRYSGYLLGYIHLSNALYRADREAWEEVRAQIPEGALTDIRYNNAYWDQFEDGVVDKVSNTVYDNMLKSYGQKDGMQSYGTVVDLLAAYYLP